MSEAATLRLYCTCGVDITDSQAPSCSACQGKPPESDERNRAATILRESGDVIPAALRGPLHAVRDSSEVPGTLRGVMEFVDQWLENRK